MSIRDANGKIVASMERNDVVIGRYVVAMQSGNDLLVRDPRKTSIEFVGIGHFSNYGGICIYMNKWNQLFNGGEYSFMDETPRHVGRIDAGYTGGDIFIGNKEQKYFGTIHRPWDSIIDKKYAAAFFGLYFAKYGFPGIILPSS